MADYSTTMPVTTSHRASWSAIFAGTFVFVAIEITFLALGIAIFGGSAGTPTSGTMTTGMSIWAGILTLFALYFGGRTAGRLSGTANRNIAMYHGLVTFGMCIFSAILVAVLILAPAEIANAGNASVSMLTVRHLFTEAGYALFASLFVGGILACVGAASEARHNAAPPMERPSNLRSVA
ncbi:MAG TPA: hypothetical protein VKT29_06040 [Terriglobales bacterium]|nr:hypothetical protein [Terriglobales bacterium]